MHWPALGSGGVLVRLAVGRMITTKAWASLLMIEHSIALTTNLRIAIRGADMCPDHYVGCLSLDE